MPRSKTEFDPAPIRIAIEHIVEVQEVELDYATACCVVFLVMLVNDRIGREAARRVIGTAIHYLDADTAQKH